MYEYVINIARLESDGRYHHFFRVEEREGHWDEDKCAGVYASLRVNYPAPDYKVDLSRRRRTWEMVEVR